MSKEDREGAIIRCVYEAAEFARLEHSDRPDFCLSHWLDSPLFGVEVTDLYASETHARLLVRPNYVADLLSGERPVHSDDSGLLHEGELYSPEGKSKGRIKLLATTEPSDDVYLAQIVARLKLKASQTEGYRNDLIHVNLIINDHWHRLRKIAGEHFSTRVLTPPVTAALLASPFREVFFVTLVAEERRAVFPMKQLLLLRAWSYFNAVIGNLSLLDSIADESIYFDLFTAFLVRTGVPARRCVGSADEPQIEYGNTCLGARADTRAIFDLADRPPPPSRAVLEWESLTTVPWIDISQSVAQVCASKFFVADLGLPVRDPEQHG